MKRPPLRKCLRLAAFAVLAVCAVFAAVPNGAAPVWNKAFSAFGLGGFSAQADGWPVAVHVLDVGKADSILIECGDRRMLVDGGTADRGKSVVSYLERRGASELEAIVNTHPDEDHVGGLQYVLKRFPAGRYYAPSLPAELVPKDDAYLGTMKALKEKGLSVRTPLPGEGFSLGELKVRVLGPVVPGADTNSNSVVLLLRYKSVRFLLMGDAGQDEEQSLIDAGADLSADVLKVGHHGSGTSTGESFLKAVRPRYAAISVGHDSSDLPKREVLERLGRAGIKTYRTDVDGTVLFLTDGKTIEVRTEK